MKKSLLSVLAASVFLVGCASGEPTKASPNSALLTVRPSATTGTPTTSSPAATAKASAALTGTPPPITAETISLPSGLRYAISKAGTGATATSGQKVSVHYTGWLASTGAKFDSSLDRGQPFELTLGKGEVIKGWDEGLVGMRVGETRRLLIPSTLAYGPRGQGPIPPNSELLFDVTLLAIK